METDHKGLDESGLIVGLDIGGSFTDLVVHSPSSSLTIYGKAPNRSGDLLASVVQCLHDLDVPWENVELVKHGTTVVINTLIQRTGAHTALVTTEGFRDVLEIGRTNWPEPYNLRFNRLPVLIEREYRLEVRERSGSDGGSVVALDTSSVADVIAKLREYEIESVAVCFLHSYIAPGNEKAVRDAIVDALPDVYVTVSHELSREFREYERTSTTAMNAYVAPAVDTYLRQLEEELRRGGFAGQLYMMESSGGASKLSAARKRPVALIESGPAGGAIAVGHLARASELSSAIAFDMGGTTAKAALVEDFVSMTTTEYIVPTYERGFPVQVPAVDIVEVGTGGGSIARVGEDGAFTVGPESAGADPGPACFGRGGSEPTVTDANVLLGRIDPERFQTGSVNIDPGLTEKALAGLGERLGKSALDTAWGILALANFNMAAMIRRVSLERGRDPRDFVLFGYGGGGPLHSVDLAAQLHIPEVVIPPLPSNFSAVGALLADLSTEAVRTVMMPIGQAGGTAWDSALDEMRKEVAAWHGVEEAELGVRIYADTRYLGQEHTLRIAFDEGGQPAVEAPDALKSAFLAEYELRYGHSFAQLPIEITNLRLVGSADIPKPQVASLAAGAMATTGSSTRAVFFPETGFLTIDVIERTGLDRGAQLSGPLAIEEYGSTTILRPGDRLRVDDLGQLRVTLGAADTAGPGPSTSTLD